MMEDLVESAYLPARLSEAVVPKSSNSENEVTRMAVAKAAPAPREGLAVWCTGLSGSGKTTICRGLEVKLRGLGFRVQVLDGDEVRQNLCRDLGFSKADRDENVFRLGYVAQLLVGQGVIVLVAAISPYQEARRMVRDRIGLFVEVYVNASLAECVRRDPKRLYAGAARGAVRGVTGLDDPYEVPLQPDVTCFTDHEAAAESVDRVLDAIRMLLPA